LEACCMTTRGLVALLNTLRSNISTYERKIQDLVAAHPDGILFASLPGAGAALVPRLITAFGMQRDRFDSAYQVQCYSGIGPVTEASLSFAVRRIRDG
ncbi:MAG: transposase, partial [Candidatus Sulfotelmatobacter sp.]